MRAAKQQQMREGAQDTQDVARMRTNAGCAVLCRVAAVGARPPALVTLSSLHRSRQLSSGRTTTRLAVPQPSRRSLGERAEAAIGSSRHSKRRLSSHLSKSRLLSLKEAALVTQSGSSRLSSLKEAARGSRHSKRRLSSAAALVTFSSCFQVALLSKAAGKKLLEAGRGG